MQNIGDLCGTMGRGSQRITRSLHVTLPSRICWKRAYLYNKRHYVLLRCITWYKQRAWREPQHTGFCITVHVRSRSFVVRCRKSFRIPWSRSYPRRAGGGGWWRRGRVVCERAPGTSRVMKVGEKGKNGRRMPAWRCRIDRTCYFLDYSRRESRSTVAASRLSPGGNGRSISLSCVNVLLPLFPAVFLPPVKPFVVRELTREIRARTEIRLRSIPACICYYFRFNVRTESLRIFRFQKWFN